MQQAEGVFRALVCPSCLAENEQGAGVCVGCGAPLRAAEAIRQGSIVAERYEVLSPLGKGGMGEVFRVRDRVLDEPVALKVLRADAVKKREMIQRFRAEVKLARRVRHRNVCAIHDYGQDGSVLFIAMEFVAGEDLRQRLNDRGRLPEEEAYDVALQVAEGLEAIHEAGVIHRDLKPANIMLDESNVVRLMDFGIAREWGANAGFTATGKIVGTPEYMSPEQIRAQPLDFRTDVYSLAVLVFELFTGRVPFVADSPVDTIMMQLKQQPPLDTPGLPPSLVPVLARALDKRPDVRQASVAAFAEELRRARDEQPAPVPTPKAETAELASPPSTPDATTTERAGLGTDDPPPRKKAHRSLADLSGVRLHVETEADAPEAVRELIVQLADSDASVRWRAAQAIGEHGVAARGATGALTEALRDPVPFVRSAAAVALKRVRG